MRSVARHPVRTLLFALACASAGCGHSALAQDTAATVVFAQGPAQTQSEGTPEWRLAQFNQALAAGDRVRTGLGARAALVLADQTQLRLHENTEIQIQQVASGALRALTALAVRVGRVWTQTRRVDGSELRMQTATATLGIRGTDWDVQVGEDGSTLVTVLSGQVRVSNDHGELQLTSQEAALAEPGKAPVKLMLSAPRDRVQWVTALRPEPERFQRLDAPLAALLTRADRLMADGEPLRAIESLQAADASLRGSPETRAQLARAQMLAGRLDDSARTLGTPREDDAAPVWLARGALARREGDARATLDAYRQATRLAPGDDRGWFGLGSALTERDDGPPARAALDRAIELAPQGAGYRGELGTLQTLRQQLPEAEASFAEALRQNPADYVALTGLGLLRLKQGQPQAVLDAFLRAGVMEPRYARAKTYTGVAYYQLERRADAIAMLEQAAALDDRDPVPYLFLAQIHTDLFQAGEAVRASRAAAERMPYLKSLNQVANDQQGRASFGAALAFFGLEDWALALAQQAYYPYFGGSHLFLADRYVGEFNKNSELFQGFLVDPLAFGASPRFSSLLPRPGVHLTLGANFERNGYRASAPSITFNGLVGQEMPLAFFVKSQPVGMRDQPIDVAVSGRGALFDPTGNWQKTRAGVTTLGLGFKPTADWGLFAYLNDMRVRAQGNNQVDRFGIAPEPSTLDYDSRQVALGASLRHSPVAQTWVKLGHSDLGYSLGSYPAIFSGFGLTIPGGIDATPLKRFSDLQLRHTADWSDSTRLALTLEHVRERQHNSVLSIGQLSVGAYRDVMAIGGVNDIERRFSALTLSAWHRATPALRLHGALAASELRSDVNGWLAAALVGANLSEREEARRQDRQRALSPRVGMVYQGASGLTWRAAYADWVRPPSVGSLAPVDVAGVPLESRFVEAGGRLKQTALHVQWSPDERNFFHARVMELRLRNPGTLGVDLRTPSLPLLEELRNAQLVNLSAVDLLEADPGALDGRVRSLGLGAARLLGSRGSVYAKYFYHQFSGNYIDENRQTVGVAWMPWLPRHILALGGTWASPARLYFSGRLVYRSLRYEDAAGLTPHPAGWKLDLVGFWESADKRLTIGAGALNLLGPQSAREFRRYVIDLKLKF